eukprot:7338715-Pyramimonas_sp.AAC.1
MAKKFEDPQASLECKKAAIATKQVDIEAFRESFAETAKTVAPVGRVDQGLLLHFKFTKEELPQDARETFVGLKADTAPKLFPAPRNRCAKQPRRCPSPRRWAGMVSMAKMLAMFLFLVMMGRLE